MDHLTTVSLDFLQGARNYRLLFGAPHASEAPKWRHGATASTARFLPGSLFGLELWERNAYGTVAWHIYALRALWPAEPLTVVPCVHPGAEILLHASGKRQARLALAWFDYQRTRTDDLTTLPAHVFQAADLHIRAGRQAPMARRQRPPYGRSQRARR